MPSTTLPTPGAVPGDPWSELERLLEDLANASRAVPPPAPEIFYRELLERTVAGLAAAGGLVWERASDGTLRRTAAQLPGDLSPTALEDFSHSGTQRLERIVTAEQPRAVAPGSADDARNRTPYLLLQSSWRGADGVAGVLEILQRPGASPAAQAGYLHFLSLVCELAGDFERRRSLRELQEQNQFQSRVLELAANVSRSLELAPTAYDLVQEARRILGVDRVSLLQVRGKHCRVLAVSGVDKVERRSGLIRKLENLTELVVSTKRAVWYLDSPAGIPPRILSVLQDLLVESGARRLGVLPLSATGNDAEDNSEAGIESERILGALIVEQFQAAGDTETLRRRSEAVQAIAAPVLQGAVTHSSMPLQFVSRGAQKILDLLSGTRFPKTLLVLAVVTAVGLALTLIRAELRIEGRGKLQPKLRRDLFAAADGVVRTIRTRHEANVKEGEVLVELRQSELDFETARILGEIQTNQQRLSSVQALRLSATTDRGEGREKYAQLTSEEEELKAQLKSLGEQRRILELRQEELSLKSPITGQVLTWDVEQLLTARPVQRGQVLLTVGDLNGPWEMEVEVPDDQIGHILEAQKQSKKLPVSFALASSPGVVHEGTVERVALAADTDENRRPVVIVTVSFDASRVQPLRPGLAALPRIHCGQRPVGYVWFHRLWEAIQSWMLF